MGACLAACDEHSPQGCYAGCTSACHDDCSSACGSTCSTACNAYCVTQGAVRETACRDFFESSHADDVCDTCDDTCRQTIGDECDSILNCVIYDAENGDTTGCVGGSNFDIGDIADDVFTYLVAYIPGAIEDALECLAAFLPWFDCDDESLEAAKDRICDSDIVDCCADGDHCDSISCHDGTTCWEACQKTFLGLPSGTTCLPPQLPAGCDPLDAQFPVPGSAEYDRRTDPAHHTDFDYCGTLDTWVQTHGCIATLANACSDDCFSGCDSTCYSGGEVAGVATPGCYAECRDECRADCHVDDCAEYCIGLDLPAA